MRSSSRVPASAGEIPAGGSYIGATDIPGSGSRPAYHHKTNITRNVTGGKNTAGLLPINQTNFVSAVGCLRMPFGIYTSIVRPPRMGNGFVVSNSAAAPSTFAEALRSVER